MKVAIALATSSGQLSGVQRHAMNLARCLLTTEEITQVHLIAAPWQQQLMQQHAPIHDERVHIHIAPIGNSALSRNRWFYAQLPRMAAQLNVDLMHFAYPMPVRRSAFQCAVAVTLHDLYPYDIPENFGFRKVWFNRIVLRQCLSAVDAIACVSQSTLSRLEQIKSKLIAKKAVLIYNSVEPAEQASIQDELPAWSNSPFLLCVAQHRRNKNILLALKVFERLLTTQQLAPDTRMIVVGIPGPETPAIEKCLSDSRLADQVILVNGISDWHLQWCYRNCLLLLAPSIIEGFGLPVAEAMLTGCHVVCSDIPAFRELGSDCCRYVPLGANQERAFAEAVMAALNANPATPIALPQLSAKSIGEEYLRLYRSLIPAHAAAETPLHSKFVNTKTRQPLS